MKSKLFPFLSGALIFAALILAVTFLQAQRKIDSKGIGNMIFASTSISKGQESRVQLKTNFTPSDKIYARGYFPGPVGAFSRGEQMHVHLYVDGKVAWRGTYGTPPNASWDQMSLYMRRTGDDDFKGGMSRALDTVTSGSHEVMVMFVRDKFLKYKEVIKGNSVTKEPVYAPVNLSKGKFTFVVP